MNITISVETSAEGAAALVEWLKANQGSFEARVKEDNPASALTLADGVDMYAGLDLGRFCRRLTSAGRKAVTVISKASSEGESISTATLEQEVEPGEFKLMGVLGGVGKPWREIAGLVPNPFRGRKDADSGAYMYRIDQSLAQRLLQILARNY